MAVIRRIKTNKKTFVPTLSGLTIALGLTLLGAACASESDNQQVSANGVAPAEEICRSEAVTGSNFKRRVCLTAAEWANLDNKERAGAEEFGRQTRENSAGVAEGAELGPY
jgi:hypothetical protein